MAAFEQDFASGDTGVVFKNLLNSTGIDVRGTNLTRQNGQLYIGQNVVIDAPGRIQGRPGFPNLSNEVSLPASYRPYTATPISPWNGRVDYIFQHLVPTSFSASTTTAKYGYNKLSTTNSWTNLTRSDAGTTETFSASSSHFDAALIRNHVVFGGKNGTFWSGLDKPFLGSLGASNTYYWLGVEQGLIPRRDSVGLIAPTGSGVLANNQRCAYRAIIVYKALDGSEWVGAPSQPYYVTNTTGGARDVSLRWQLPKENGTTATALKATDKKAYLQVYRSIINVANTSEAVADMRLVYEKAISAGDVSTGYITVADIVPASGATGGLMGQDLYTNPTYEGELAAAYTAPASDSPCFWGNRIWFPNPSFKTSEIMRLVSIGGSGLVAGQTLAFSSASGSFTLTGVLEAAVPTAAQFRVYTTGTLSENIRNTVIEICQAANESSSNVICDLQPANAGAVTPDTIGAYEVRSRVIGEVITITPSVPAAYIQQDASTVTKALSTDNLAWSKVGEPHAVQIGNTGQLGPQNTVIYKMVELRNSLFAFTSYGIYIVRDPENPSFELFDPTVFAVGKQLICTDGDAIYVWAFDGIYSVTESGARRISDAINPDIQTLTNLFATTLQYSACASVDIIRGRVQFWYDLNGACALTTAYVFDRQNNAWQTWLATPSATSTPSTPGAISTLCFGKSYQRQYAFNIAATNQAYRHGYDDVTVDYKDGSYPYAVSLRWVVCNEDINELQFWREMRVHSFWSPYSVTNIFNDGSVRSGTAWFLSDVYNGTTALPETPAFSFANWPTVFRVPVPREACRSVRLAVGLDISVDGWLFAIEAVTLVVDSSGTHARAQP